MANTRLVVLISGTGSLLQVLIQACADPSFGATVVAVGSDRPDIAGLKIAQGAEIPTFVCQLSDFADRTAWDTELTKQVTAHQPDLIISAGFLKLVGNQFLATFAGRFINTHPSLLPAFPGMHAPADALRYGVKVAGCTVFFVDAGVDTGPIIEQRTVPVLPDDTPEILHERIKTAERAMLVDVVQRLAQHGWTIMDRKVTIP